jgi:hypothetical protein
LENGIEIKEIICKEGLISLLEGGAFWKASLQLVKRGAVQRRKNIFADTASEHKYLKNIYDRGI